MENQTYTIELEHFKGPFDLLLFFIQRDELDIQDIPIKKVTADFLDYIRKMEELNIELASEFILVAATLMRIKAKMLLPRKPVDEEGNEIDPRKELVNRLLEYRQYKDILDDLRRMEDIQGARHERGNVSENMKNIAQKALIDVELENLDLFNLLKAFQRVLERSESTKKKVHTIFNYTYSIRGQQEYILDQIPTDKPISFNKLFLHLDNRVHAIVTFLALLELANLQRISILIGEGINNLRFERGMTFDEGLVGEEE